MVWDLIEKSGNPLGGGLDYDEGNMAYNVNIDLDTGLSVTYNGLGGVADTWSYIAKN